MTINAKTKSLIFLFLAYFSVFVISYSTFLQTPIFEGEAIAWRSIIEQSVTWIPVTLAYLYLLSTVMRIERIEKPYFAEMKLLIPGLLLVFTSAFSVGIHAVAQIAEEFLGAAQDTNFYRVMFFFDEYIGHLFFVTLTIAVFLVMLLEINRKTTTLSRVDNAII